MDASPPSHAAGALLGWLLLLVLSSPSSASAGTLPAILEFEILPPAPTEADDISIRIFGVWPDSCVPMEAMASILEAEILIATVSIGPACLLTLTPWSETVPIGHLAAGEYEVIVTNAFLPGPQEEIGRTVLTVPEPSSWLLGLTALAGTVGTARRVRFRARSWSPACPPTPHALRC